MSRTARSIRTKLIIIGFILVVLAVPIVLWQTSSPKPARTNSETVVTQPPQTTQLSYKGENGKTVLELLRKHARVETKSSSIGEYVTSINDNDGGGTKYWLFYINGKESSEGAASYRTNDGETIEWRLQ